MKIPLRLFKHVQLANMAVLGAIGTQLLLVPLVTGMVALDYFPLGGICFALVSALWLGYHYHFNPVARSIVLALDALCIGLSFLWLVEFSGPYDRLLQGVLLVLAGLNVSGIVLNIVSGVRAHQEKGSSEGRRDWGARQRALGISIAVLLTASAAFAALATFDFFQTYAIQAPAGATTRSSFWGPPHYHRVQVNAGIATSNTTRLEVSNATLSVTPSNLRPGGFMYVIQVNHTSTPGVNYCDYSAGARSFPNGTVILSQPLPNTTGVGISFYYIENVRVMEYLVQTNSRLITSNWGGNQSWIESPSLFHAIDMTYEFQLLEYWNISYYINIGVAGFEFPQIFNYAPWAARGLAVLQWINASQPHLHHCLGISYDYEKGEIVQAWNNPDRPDMGENPFPGLVRDKGWYESNEQNDEALGLAQAAYFSVYDYAASIERSVYVVYQYSGMADYGEGDIDITRLPMWRHPACEYGMMSYQDGKEGDDEALWDIYKNVHNQVAVYGDLGRSILTGWIDQNASSPYSKHYTNDEAGFQRYLRDVKAHQACGITEIFHAPLFSLQLKWGDDAILRVHDALNVDPKETFTFRAEPWSDFDTELNDIVENFNKPWAAIAMLAAMATIMGSAFIDSGKFGRQKGTSRSGT
ncbi:MAG: hypothetical protein JW839_16590 [Candidatus Lokiarchaeota archaeon]|nr:hypothetical protein [Candidatus Lokiarchaeota archaeon]